MANGLAMMRRLRLLAAIVTWSLVAPAGAQTVPPVRSFILPDSQSSRVTCFDVRTSHFDVRTSQRLRLNVCDREPSDDQSDDVYCLDPTTIKIAARAQWVSSARVFAFTNLRPTLPCGHVGINRPGAKTHLRSAG